MGMGEDFALIYMLQDRVLEALASLKSPFYLTGGTCLNRFYSPRRHSDDLDLFIHEENIFREEVRRLREKLRGEGLSLALDADTRDFVRMKIEGTLRIDLVNDRLFRVGRPLMTKGGFWVDNKRNILVNKIGAILGRDDPKDVFDLVTLTRIEEFDWGEVLNEASKKTVIDRDYFVYRLKTFPLALLDRLWVVNEHYLKEAKDALPRIVGDILQERRNLPTETPLMVP